MLRGLAPQCVAVPASRGPDGEKEDKGKVCDAAGETSQTGYIYHYRVGLSQTPQSRAGSPAASNGIALSDEGLVW